MLWEDTKADAVANLGGYPEASIIGVFTDETRGGALVFYRVENGELIEALDTGDRATRSAPSIPRFAITVPRSTLGLVEVGGSLSVSDSVRREYLQQALDEIANPASRYKSLFIDSVPEKDGYWGIDFPLVLQDGATIYGVGPSSHLKNTRISQTIAGQGRVLDYGNMPTQGPNAFGLGIACDIEPASAGSVIIELSEIGDAQAFAPGDIVWVRTSEQISGPIYSVLQINLVTEVDEEAGTVRLFWPITDTIAGAAPKLCKTDGIVTDGLGIVRRLTKNVTIRDLSLSTGVTTEGWEAAGGAVNLHLINLETDSRGPIYSNAFSHCYFQNIGSTFRNRFIEIAGYSDFNVIENVRGTFTPGIEPTSEPLISFGENSNYNRLSGFIINGDECAEGQLFRSLFGSYNTIENGKAFVRGLTDSAFYFAVSGAGRCRGNIVRNVEAWMGSPTRLVHIQNSATADEGGNLLKDVVIHGTPSSRAITFHQSNNMTIDGLTFDAGSIEVLSPANGAVLRNIETLDAHHAVFVATPAPGNKPATLSNFRSGTTAVLGSLKTIGADTSATQSITPVELFSVTIPAGTVRSNDAFHLEARAFPTGTIAAKHLEITLNGTVLDTFDFGAGDTSPVSIELTLDVVFATTTKRLFGQLFSASGGKAINGGMSVDGGTTAMTLAINGYVEDAGDTLTLRRPRVTPLRQYELG